MSVFYGFVSGHYRPLGIALTGLAQAERASDIIKQDNAGNNPGTSTTRTTATATTSRATSTSSQPATTGVAIHPVGNRNKCLDVAGNTRADGTAVEYARLFPLCRLHATYLCLYSLYDCNDTAAQKWTFTRGATGGQIRLAGSNYCLDAGSNPGNGIKMKIWTVSMAAWAGSPTGATSDQLVLLVLQRIGSSDLDV